MFSERIKQRGSSEAVEHVFLWNVAKKCKMTKDKGLSLAQLPTAGTEQMVLVPIVYDSETGSKGTLTKSAWVINQGGVADERKGRK